MNILGLFHSGEMFISSWLGYRSQPLGVEYKGLIEFADKARRKDKCERQAAATLSMKK